MATFVDKFNALQAIRREEIRKQEEARRAARTANLQMLHRERLAEQRRQQAATLQHERTKELAVLQARLARGGAAGAGGALAATAPYRDVRNAKTLAEIDARRAAAGGATAMAGGRTRAQRALDRHALSTFGALASGAQAGEPAWLRSITPPPPGPGVPQGGPLTRVRTVGGTPVYERTPRIAGMPIYERNTAGQMVPRTFPRGDPRAAAGPVATPFEEPKPETVGQAETVLDGIIKDRSIPAHVRTQALRLQAIIEDPTISRETKEIVAGRVYELLAMPAGPGPKGQWVKGTAGEMETPYAGEYLPGVGFRQYHPATVDDEGLATMGYFGALSPAA